MRRRFAIPAAIALACLATAWAGDAPTWLVGKWVLAEAPEGTPKETLSFAADKTFTTVQSATGKGYHGSYTVGDEIVTLKLKRDGKVFATMELAFDEGKDKLYFQPFKDGPVSYYVKE